MAVIYQTYRQPDAEVLAYVVDDPGEAHLWVYLSRSRGQAHGDSCWYVTREWGKASTRVYFSSRGRADLLVYYVGDRGQARWNRPHKLHGQL